VRSALRNGEGAKAPQDEDSDQRFSLVLYRLVDQFCGLELDSISLPKGCCSFGEMKKTAQAAAMLDLLDRLAFAKENVDEGGDERRKDAVETSDRVRGDARGDSLVRAERSSSAVGLGWKLAIASSILLGIAALCVGVYAVFVGIAASASVSVAQQKQGGATRSWSMQNNSLTAGPTAGPESTLENQAIGPSQASRDYISPEVVETLKSAVQRSGIVIDPFGARSSCSLILFVLPVEI